MRNKEINTNVVNDSKIEIPENYRNDFIKAMKIGYYKEFYRKGLITAEQLEMLINIQNETSNETAA